MFLEEGLFMTLKEPCQKVLKSFSVCWIEYIYIHEFSRRFYPNWLALRSRYIFDQFIYFLGFEPMTLVLQAPCSTVWAEGIMWFISMFWFNELDVWWYFSADGAADLRRRCDSEALKLYTEDNNKSWEEQKHKRERNKIKLFQSGSQKDISRLHFTSNL